MKKHFFQKKINLLTFILIILTASATYAQQQLTHTVTVQSRGCNNGCSVLDIPELNNNAAAIILATPVLVNGVNLNPHPIGAYYMYLNKWSIFNLDGIPIAIGAKFNVEYYVNPGSDRFVYIVPPKAHQTDVAYIDHAGLNNNPNAQIRFFPTVSPTIGAIYNRYDKKVEYDATVSKWFIANINNNPVPSDCAFNIVFSTGPMVTNPKGDKNINSNVQTPVTNSPNGNAGGDLSGTYPNPKVIGLQGKPLSNDPPAVGQVLKWNGSAWEPANENATGNTYNAGTGLAIQGSTIYANTIAPLWNANKLSGNSISNTTPTIGQVLKWNGTSWEPAADNVGSSSQTPTTAKPSVVFFNQNNPPVGMLQMLTPNVNTATIGGLDNQFFTLTQSSRIVFHTTIAAQNGATNDFAIAEEVNVWLTVEILNPSGVMVARAVSETVLGGNQVFTIIAVGIGVLPAGTYHTRVTMNRGTNGSPVRVFDGGYSNHPTQGGQMIIEIFPD